MTDARAFRWPSRSRGRLRLYIDPHSDRPGWTPQHLELAERVLRAWSACGVVDVISTSELQTADIRLHWTDGLPPAHPGITLLTPNERGELSHADVWVNVTAPARPTATMDEVLYGIIAHEVGHALGLPHSPDRADVMHGVLYTLEVTEDDLATLRAVAGHSTHTVGSN